MCYYSSTWFNSFHLEIFGYRLMHCLKTRTHSDPKMLKWLWHGANTIKCLCANEHGFIFTGWCHWSKHCSVRYNLSVQSAGAEQWCLSCQKSLLSTPVSSSCFLHPRGNTRTCWCVKLLPASCNCCLSEVLKEIFYICISTVSVGSFPSITSPSCLRLTSKLSCYDICYKNLE